jgi:methylmalonyl-CoA/ethylmalonyl-CoA epimerase
LIGIERIDHICVAVRDLEAAMKTWALFLGKDKPDLEYELDAEAIKVVRYYVGEVGWELMVSTKENSDVDRFIKNHGEGIMLVSFKVPDTTKAMETLKQNGFEMIDQQPRSFYQSKYAFMNPKFMNGVLVEIIDEK